ncbi:TonB-dependent receptor [Sphingomonas bisphenolicum]
MAVLATPALAQDSGTNDIASGAAPTENPVFSTDIIVTANKREERLDRVGTTIAVLSGSQLQEKRVVSLADLAGVVPGLSFTNSNFGSPVYTLRGVGFYEASLGAYPTVSLYVDEAPLPFPVLTRHSDYDLERVEVLKGPQGTLFGQNATGGAINFIAAKPTDALAAGGDLTYGRFNEVIANAYASGPLSDTLKARISGRVRRADGWQKSNSRDDSNGKINELMGRLLLSYEPSERVRLNLNVNGWIDKSETQAGQVIAFNFQSQIPSQTLLDQPLSPQTSRAADWTPGVTDSNNRMVQASLRGDFDVTDTITLTSLSSYVDYKQRQSNDPDGLPLSNYNFLNDNGFVKSYYQEFRVANNDSGPVRWIVGANYQRNKTQEGVRSRYSDASISNTLGTTFGYFIRDSEYTIKQKFTSKAAFGGIEFDVVPDVTLKGSARYTKSTVDYNECSLDPTALPDNTGAFFYDVLLGGQFGTYSPGDCYALNDTGVQNGDVAPGAPGPINNRLSEDNVSWKLGVDWRTGPDSLLYVNVTKGYKAGSFPTIGASVSSQYRAVTQEELMSYEAGFKLTTWNKRLRLSGAAFYYDYVDKQIRAKRIDPTFGILDVLQNIPKSKVKGFETSLSAAPVQGLTLTATYTYLDAKIKEFQGINGGGVAADFSGSTIPYTSKHSLDLGVRFQAPVSNSLNGFVDVNYMYRSSSYAVIGGDINPPNARPNDTCLFCMRSYALVNGSIGVKSADDRWSAAVWGSNIFNKYYWTNVIANYDTIIRFTGRPATYGVTVSLKY